MLLFMILDRRNAQRDFPATWSTKWLILITHSRTIRYATPRVFGRLAISLLCNCSLSRLCVLLLVRMNDDLS